MINTHFACSLKMYGSAKNLCVNGTYKCTLKSISIIEMSIIETSTIEMSAIDNQIIDIWNVGVMQMLCRSNVQTWWRDRGKVLLHQNTFKDKDLLNKKKFLKRTKITSNCHHPLQDFLKTLRGQFRLHFYSKIG